MSEQNTLNLEKTGEIDSVEKYKFEPIKGYPMLNWHGKRPFTSTQYYPAQKKEVYGEEVNGWINKIFWGDNLQVMSHLLKEYRGKVDLIYIDPPFDSKADYKKKIKLKGKLTTNDSSSFEEKQYTDIWSNDEYLQFMYERILLLRELLSETGSIYVHCDWRKSHYIRLILDEIFGQQNHQNEITWVRASSHNDTSNRYSRVKDTIFFYSKSSSLTFNTQYTEYDQSYIDSEWRKLPSGRYYKSENMLDPRSSMKEFDFHGTTARWRTSEEKMEAMWNAEQTEVPGSNGRIKLGKNGCPIKRCRIMFLDEMLGNPLNDNWSDISYIAGGAKESVGYPTQKPESLIERIIKTSSNDGDLVFDCFMGSGTVQAVAMKNNRRFIGSDINLGAIQTTIKRLIQVANQVNGLTKVSTGIEVYNVNNYDVFRNPVEAVGLLLEALEIESVSGTIYDGEKDGYMVKVMPVNRISTREDLNELLANFPYKVFDRRKEENPNKAVESVMLICMGHEADLKAHLEQECGYKLNVEVVDVLRDKSHIEFKRDSEAEIHVSDGELKIDSFFPMNLLQKLSMQKDTVGEWRELVESVVIDWNYDGSAMELSMIDIPEKNEFVSGRYRIPDDAGTIKIKITDLLSESYEDVINHG